MRAQNSYSNYVLRIIHILLYSENYNNCASPSWLGPAPTRSALTSQAETGRKTQILRCPPIRPFSYAQGKLFSLRAGPAQAQALPSHCGRGGVYYCRLYQISHLPVKYNFLVMHWHAFLIKLCRNAERAGTHRSLGVISSTYGGRVQKKLLSLFFRIS